MTLHFKPTATMQVIPVEEREPLEAFVARLSAHVAAQDEALRQAGYDRAFPNRVAARQMREGREDGPLRPCSQCKATALNNVPGYGARFRSYDGLCARCLERQLGVA
jgi:hypothetical protein